MTARTVVRNEWRLLMADRALRAVLALFALLLLYALANGIVWARFQERTVETALAGNAERARALGEELAAIENGAEPASRFRDPRAPNVLGGARGSHTAALDPGPLTALAVGQSDLLPYYYDVNIYTNESTFQQNGEVENPLNLMVGRFDLAFVVIYLLPLLILALSYNVLSEEREQGTLALTLSQPGASWRLSSPSGRSSSWEPCSRSRSSGSWQRGGRTRPDGSLSGARRWPPTPSSGSRSRRG